MRPGQGRYAAAAIVAIIPANALRVGSWDDGPPPGSRNARTARIHDRPHVPGGLAARRQGVSLTGPRRPAVTGPFAIPVLPQPDRTATPTAGSS